MISATLLLIIAIILFYQSLRVLRKDVFSTDVDDLSRLHRFIRLCSSIITLILWFVAGIIAFVASISDYASFVILNLQ